LARRRPISDIEEEDVGLNFRQTADTLLSMVFSSCFWLCVILSH